MLAPACLSGDHPRYLSFIPNAPTKAASAFDMVVGASSVYGGSWLEGAGAVFAENQALRWVADLAGLPATAGGVFVPGGTVGNLSALVAARVAATARRGGRLSRPTGAAVARHRADPLVGQAFAAHGHGRRHRRRPGGRSRPDDRSRRCGRPSVRCPTADRERIFAVVVTAGSTNLGIVDDIAGCGEVAREQGWWLHVDGAYGGAALAAPSVRSLFAGIEQADSFIVDPHKWLFVPYDCCALLYRDPQTGRAAHTQHADYLDPVTVEGEWNPSDYAIQLTRRARGLPFWFSLAVNGTAAYTAAIEQTLTVARAGAELIRRGAAPAAAGRARPQRAVFERLGWEIDDYDRWNEWLVEQQLGFVTPSRSIGRACTRFAIVNPQTSRDDLDDCLIDSMR